ncbi:MAG: alpha/beta hydrolase [Acidimicrobiia bacterium]|nr:alpha/beta hydrolase [Acidimicrobiia bacterium]
MSRVEPDAPDAPRAPWSLAPPPPGRRIELPGRGTTFVREVPGPPGAPAVLLLHGWMASGGLNWFRAFDALGTRFRVVAPDHRGHARGLRADGCFRLADCADDVAALVGALGIRSAVAVGYSMGGPVAQLLWRRHPHLVDGLVLCATAHGFVADGLPRTLFGAGVAAATGAARAGGRVARVPAALGRSLLPRPARRPSLLPAWAAAELGRHHWPTLVEAAHALTGYSAEPWIRTVDVPTAVMVTTRDRLLPAGAQAATARALPGASVHLLDRGHGACVSPDFGARVLVACEDVVERIAPGTARATRVAS